MFKVFGYGDEVKANPVDGNYNTIELLTTDDYKIAYDINRPIENVYENLSEIKSFLSSFTKTQFLTDGVFENSLTHEFLLENTDFERVTLNGTSKTYVRIKPGIATVNTSEDAIIVNKPNTRLAERQLNEILRIDYYRGIEKTEIKYNEAGDWFKARITKRASTTDYGSSVKEYGGSFDDDGIAGISSIALLTAIYNDPDFMKYFIPILGTNIEKILLEPMFEITEDGVHYTNITDNGEIIFSTTNDGLLINSCSVDDYTVPTISSIDNFHVTHSLSESDVEWHSLNSNYINYTFKVGEPIILIDDEAYPSNSTNFSFGVFIGLFISKDEDRILVKKHGDIDVTDLNLFPYSIPVDYKKERGELLINNSGELLLDAMPNNEDYYVIGEYSLDIQRDATFENVISLTSEYNLLDDYDLNPKIENFNTSTHDFIKINERLYRKEINKKAWVELTNKDIIGYSWNALNDVIFHVSNGVIFYSNDNGNTWETQDYFVDLEEGDTSIKFISYINNNWYIIINNLIREVKKIYKSSDLINFEKKEELNLALFANDEYSRIKKMFYLGSNIIVGFSDDNDVIRSEDNGETWSYIINISDDAGHPNYTFDDAYYVNNALYHIGIGTRRSTDNGDTWALVFNYNVNDMFSYYESNLGQNVFVGQGEKYINNVDAFTNLIVTDIPLYRSLDGITWETVENHSNFIFNSDYNYMLEIDIVSSNTNIGIDEQGYYYGGRSGKSFFNVHDITYLGFLSTPYEFFVIDRKGRLFTSKFGISSINNISFKLNKIKTSNKKNKNEEEWINSSGSLFSIYNPTLTLPIGIIIDIYDNNYIKVIKKGVLKIDNNSGRVLSTSAYNDRGINKFLYNDDVIDDINFTSILDYFSINIFQIATVLSADVKGYPWNPYRRVYEIELFVDIKDLSPKEGDVKYDTGTLTLKRFDGTAWQNV